MVSSITLPRVENFSPEALYSFCTGPLPTPRMILPSDRVSRVEISLARVTGCLKGGSRTDVPSFSRLVTADTSPSVVRGSMNVPFSLTVGFSGTQIE